jgi:hypothetical protein
MHEGDGDGADARRHGRAPAPTGWPRRRAARPPRRPRRGVRGFRRPVHGAVPATGSQVEEAWPRLRADPQEIAEAFGHQQEDPGPLALQQRVGRHGRAHLDAFDRGVVAAPEAGDPLDGGIGVMGRVLGQELRRHECAVGASPDDVGERAATVDPELPLAHAAPPVARVANKSRRGPPVHGTACVPGIGFEGVRSVRRSRRWRCEAARDPPDRANRAGRFRRFAQPCAGEAPLPCP